MSEEPHLLIDEQESILIATLNRPDKLNALSVRLTHDLGEAVERFRDTPELKVMLIRATGRYFSAGADLKEGAARPRGATPATGSAIREMHGYGHYHETYERLPAGWRIKTLKLTRLRVNTVS